MIPDGLETFIIMKTKTTLGKYFLRVHAAILAVAAAASLHAAPMDSTTVADFDFSTAQQIRTQTLIDNGTLELQRILTGPTGSGAYRHMGWPVATRLPDGRTVVLIRHLLDHSAYASYPDNARRIIWSDDNMATWQPTNALTAEPPFGRNLEDTPTKYDYQGMHAMSWAYTSGSSAPRLVAVTAQQDGNDKTPRSRVYLSDDRGVTWREQPGALVAMPANAVHSGPNMVCHPEFGLVVPFGQVTTSGSNQPNFLAASTDAGETWEIRTWPNATTSRNVEPALATWGPGHMVIIGRDYNGMTPTSTGKNAREAHDTPDVIYNPVTGRIEVIQSSRWGNGAENPLPADPTDPAQCNNSLNIWSIDPVDLLNGGTTWRFDGNLIERQGIILGGSQVGTAPAYYKDGYHPGGSIVDEAAGKQHIFIYVGVYTSYANAYRISRPLDTYTFREACGLRPLPRPAITGVSVSGSFLTIAGINFAAIKEVLVAGKTAAISSSSITEIRVTFPEGVASATADDVVVRTDNGIAAGLSNLSQLPPAVSAITYDAIWPGKSVTITGVNLGGVTKVLFGAMEVTAFVSKTDTEIVVTVPAGVASGDISIQTGDGKIVPLPMSGAYAIAIKPFNLAPLVDTQPVVIGLHPLDLIAFATGTPQPSYAWQYRPDNTSDWADIHASPDYEGLGTANLTILNTAGKNNWQFRYAATNNTEDVYSNPATIKLLAETLPAPVGIIAVSGASTPDLYVTDLHTHTIQKISQAGWQAATYAGQPGSPGDTDGPATAAQLRAPRAAAFTPDGELIIADTGNSLIRAVAADGTVTTTSTAFRQPRAVAIDDVTGEIYVSDTASHLIKKISPAGDITILAGSGIPGNSTGIGPAAQFNRPSGIAIDIAGNLYIADTGNNCIRYLDLTTGSVSTLAGRPTVAAGGNDGNATTAATFRGPEGVAVDAIGQVFVADTGNSRIRRIYSGTVVSISGQSSGIAGFKDGSGTTAWFDRPAALAFDEDGHLYVADTGNAVIRRIEAMPDGLVYTNSPVTTLPVMPVTGPGILPPSPGEGEGGGGGGGGAPSIWFAAALAALLAMRTFSRRRQ